MTEQIRKRVSDYYPEPEGLTSMADALDKDFILEHVTVRTGQHGEYVVLQGEMNDKPFSVQTGAAAVVRKSQECQNQNYLPLIARLVQHDNWIDLV